MFGIFNQCWKHSELHSCETSIIAFVALSFVVIATSVFSTFEQDRHPGIIQFLPVHHSLSFSAEYDVF